MDLLTLVLTLVLVLIPTLMLVRRIRRHLQIASIINKIPGPPSYPFIGTALSFIGKPVEEIFSTINELVEEYGPGPFRTWSGSDPNVTLCRAEDIEIIVSNPKHNTKGKVYTFLYPWLGDGLLLSAGSKWHSRRKIITPAFHFKILDVFQEIFTDNSDILVRKLANKANGTTFNIYPYITRCALDMICETAMGVKVNAQEQADSEYVSAIYKFAELTVLRFHRPWLHSDSIYNLTGKGKELKQTIQTMHNFTNKVIKERWQYKLENKDATKQSADDEAIGKKKRLAFLDMLMEARINGQPLSDEDIREETDTFMFEGHDTTTAGISWALLMLGHHADVQARVHEELDSIFQGDEDREITKQDTIEMKYLEMVIKETLRMYPSVPSISRTLGEDTEIGGYKVPKDTYIAFHIYGLHHDEKHFPNPYVFDPERFAPDAVAKRHPFAYIPFSAGGRNCIGQKFALLEEKIVIASIMRKYSIKSMDPVEKIPLVGTFILRPGNGVNVTIKRRTHASTL